MLTEIERQEAQDEACMAQYWAVAARLQTQMLQMGLDVHPEDTDDRLRNISSDIRAVGASKETRWRRAKLLAREAVNAYAINANQTGANFLEWLSAGGDMWMQHALRMSRARFDEVCALFAPSMRTVDGVRTRLRSPLELTVAMGLFYVFHGVTFVGLALVFRVPLSTSWRNVEKFLVCVCEHNKTHSVISFPDTFPSAERLAQGFAQSNPIWTRAMGAIDGKQWDAHISKVGFPSLQAV